MLIRYIVMGCLALRLLPCVAQLSELKSAIAALQADVDMRPASWGLTVLDAATGQTMAGYDSHRSLTPASSLKVITSASALALLGEQFRFETHLEYDGALGADGVLRGNLYIYGSGDPSLGSDRLGEQHAPDKLMALWVEVIRRTGIKSIQGKIIGDGSAFGTQMAPGGWAWEDLGNYFGAGASGLNFHENYFSLYLKSGPNPGDAVEILRSEPASPELTLINELRAGPKGSGDNSMMYGAPYASQRYLRGSIPPGRSSFVVKGALAEPALTCARFLAEQLANGGIRATGGASSYRLELLNAGRMAGQRRRIYTHYSPPLRELIVPLNQESINLYAECLLLAIARKQGKAGDLEAGAGAMRDYWKNSGVDVRGMNLCDGSGLSQCNALTTFQLADILARAQRAPWREAFSNSLPLAGRSGTLEYMLRGTIAEGRLRAKSGYIGGVRAYAGLVQARSGKTYAFAMIANHFDCTPGEMRRKFEKLMVAITGM